MQDLRDTPEQIELRKLFTGYGKTAPTTPCPCCCPQMKKRTACWTRGTCGDLVALRCNNCNYIRTSKPKQAPRFKGLTIGQERAVMRIQAAVERHVYDASKFDITYKVAEEQWSQGIVSVSFDWSMKNSNAAQRLHFDGSAMFCIGVKGGARLYYYRVGMSDKEHCRKMAGYLAESAHATLKLS